MGIYSDFTAFFTLIYLKQLHLQDTCPFHEHCQKHQKAAHYRWSTLSTTTQIQICLLYFLLESGPWAGGMGIYSDFTTFFTLIYLK